ncbi:E3 ubiquitin-protein ligase [Fulvia fulva]|uniref:E3 ubiquitin-protein ligase n=1 Tax=Passalora fulva TaxID=5499 RepID=A0A9Q8USL5_PASFU|nr:E3 ubiquitin-protein ligase [Fulvia fulva]KAK4617649.1 E3 ubiquitin-protein ligase [Fulvia fulva]KAK4618906.1 E3 ubiquitin-protein ligase [Fulvia fulva]UJO20907.1 E3 ubiquitin-protein ligase [Fulvia fulva]WPV18629.1 E3 ubiquitin-protein ligase [Fulvia fulva]WPV32758.1 E3 ubiquitin-protein ligase [Fulvia fulva]
MGAFNKQGEGEHHRHDDIYELSVQYEKGCAMRGWLWIPRKPDGISSKKRKREAEAEAEADLIKATKQWLITQLKNRATSNIKCAQASCTAILVGSEISSVARSDTLEQYREKATQEYFKQYPNYIECPNADCTYGYIVEQGDSSIFNCRVCLVQYCMKCVVNWHDDETCEDYRARIRAETAGGDRATKKLLRREAKLCPRYKAWIQKISGCDHMTCKCGFEFCYVCLGAWDGFSRGAHRPDCRINHGSWFED